MLEMMLVVQADEWERRAAPAITAASVFEFNSSSSSVVDDDITPLHDATHHTSTNMCGMSKTATSVVAAATNIDGSLDGSSTIGSVR